MCTQWCRGKMMCPDIKNSFWSGETGHIVRFFECISRVSLFSTRGQKHQRLSSKHREQRNACKTARHGCPMARHLSFGKTAWARQPWQWNCQHQASDFWHRISTTQSCFSNNTALLSAEYNFPGKLAAHSLRTITFRPTARYECFANSSFSPGSCRRTDCVTLKATFVPERGHLPGW